MLKLQYPNICIIEWNAIHLKPGNKLTLHDDMHFYKAFILGWKHQASQKKSSIEWKMKQQKALHSCFKLDNITYGRLQKKTLWVACEASL